MRGGGLANERFRVLARGRSSPEWADVEADTVEHESVIMCAELHARKHTGEWDVVDITPLVYHLPRTLMISPLELGELVLGRCDAELCGDIRVEIILLDRAVTFQSHESVTSDMLM